MANINWIKLFSEDISLETQVKVLPSKGNLVYEYNPFRNYRIQETMYEYKGSIYSLGQLLNVFGICLQGNIYNRKKSSNTIYTYDLRNNHTGETGWETTTDLNVFKTWVKDAYEKGHNASRKNLDNAIQEADSTLKWEGVPDTETDPVFYEKGELVDFITDELHFSLNNPVNIIPQYSYDGSVNLILNDGINEPRLINSRFSATGRNTYEIVDRKGNNDTNIYDQGEQFDIDTSLYKKVIKIPKIEFAGESSGGNLKCGNYYFYFKLSDADGNETDFVGESGLVSVFIGTGDPQSVHTGSSEQNTFKCVRFIVSNIDSAYDYVSVYYSKSYAQLNMSSLITYKRIDKKFLVNNAEVCEIVITGFEDEVEITAADINLNYNVVDAVKTQATCQNMLMLGNVHKPDIPYDELSDLSLRFLPYLKEEEYTLDIDYQYNIKSTTLGYYDPEFIYKKVGYWGKEIYRLGVVYILKNNELSPVFNIRGGNNITAFKKQNTYNDGQFTEIPVWKTVNGKKQRVIINYNESTYYLQNNVDAVSRNELTDAPLCLDENIKGVIRFEPEKDAHTIYSLDIRISDEAVQELKKYVKGWFFVRQKRMPTILCQGLTIGIDQQAHTPTIPTADGFLSEISDSLDKTYVETEDINDVNFISEGFLERYSFQIKAKHSGLFSKILKGVLIGVAAVAVAAAIVYTAGGATALVGAVTSLGGTAAVAGSATIAGAVTVGAVSGATLVSVAIGAGIVGTTVGAIMATAGITEEIALGLNRQWTKKKIDGRNTKIPAGFKLEETGNSRKITNEFKDRFIPKDSSVNKVQAIICPEYELNQPYYNQIFTGNTHLIELTKSQNINILNGHSTNYLTNDKRHFYADTYYDRISVPSYTYKVQAVPDDTPLVTIGDMKFRSRAGYAEEAWRYEFIGKKYESNDEKKSSTDIIRGSFGPYLAFSDTGNHFQPAETVNIYIPEYSVTDMDKYFSIRMQDSSTFMAIGDRMSIEDMDDYLIKKLSVIKGSEDRSCGYQFNQYRGDCYLCQFTHRVVRNFQDPSAPFNDKIVDENTWRNNYTPEDVSKFSDINLGDVNAVQLGMWVTFRIRASENLNIRTIDDSWVDETLTCGHPRTYYPYSGMSVEGSYKIPDSACYNAGFKTSLSERYNFALPDVPYIKNWFGTRIMYSDIHINDAYKNGYRVFKGTNFIDCPRTYGEITKLVEYKNNLIVVFEHGIGYIEVNSSNVAKQVQSGNDYINVANVLSQPVIISDVIGSQWPESILKTPGNFGDGISYVYGVDTVAKKIWRCNGQNVECISDMKVQEFLNGSISLQERENTPVIGIRNVKTCYNSFKRDVMFTFYDNLQGFEENVWNLCWNEMLQMFITFYSWVPSYMENINNIPFSFNRNTSKWIAKLGISHADNSFADGITLTNNIIENNWTSTTDGTTATSFKADIMEGPLTDGTDASNGYVKKETLSPDGTNETKWTVTDQNYKKGLIGILGLTGVNLPSGKDIIYKIDYSLERDNFKNYKFFEIKEIGYYTHHYKDNAMASELISINNVHIPVYGLYLKDVSAVDLASELYYRNAEGNRYSDWDTNKCTIGDLIKTTDGNHIEVTMAREIEYNLPIYKDRSGRRPTLERQKMINPTHIVRLLNIKATVYGFYGGVDKALSEYFYDYAKSASNDKNAASKPIDGLNPAKGSWINCGYYESVVAVIPRWNMQFLSTDFWKHGQAGLIDIADKIYPTYWYGEQHPFEFEFVVVNDASVHKVFTNLEIVSNNAKPESFHYEIVGDTYDFAKDKVNMYFRQEAMKALYQYNGADIIYNRNYLETQPHQNKVSADLPHTYYARQDTFNEIYDSYKQGTSPDKDYDHLTGSEIVYYPTRQEYRVWVHQKATSMDDFDGDSTSKQVIINGGKFAYGDDAWENARALLSSNCKYVEDRWKVTINPIVICYRNEYATASGNNKAGGLMNWNKSLWTSPNRPKLPVFNSPLPENDEGDKILQNGLTDNDFPAELKSIGYTIDDLDSVNWLDNVDIHGFLNSGVACNREEIDVRDKFVKIRIRYTGDKLAVIDFINTIYQVSLA